MMRQLQSIGKGRFFDVALQSGPAGKPGFACDGELCIAQAQ